jgi:hypothetical protein
MTQEEYKAKTSKFTEEDFKNPPPEMESDMWYILAYADWSRDNGLTKSFNNAKEAIEWLHSEED